MFVDEVKYFSLKYAWKKRLFHIFVTRVYLTVCSFHVTCAFQSESTLYSCLNFKERFAQNRRGIYLNVCLRTKWLWIGILLQPLGLIFDDIFGPKKNDLFCPVFVFHRVMSIGILKYKLYFKSESLNISWISRYNSILGLTIQCSTLSRAGFNFIFLICDGSIWDLGGKFRQKQIYLFWVFWHLIFKFFSKRGSHEKHHNPNVAELAHCIIGFQMQELGVCLSDKGILVWHLFP